MNDTPGPMENPYANVLITGASSGLGRALSLWFASRGARVYAAARRVDMLASLKAEADVGPGVVIPVPLDVSHTDEVVAKLLALDDATPGGIDLVVANAGIGGMLNAQRTEWPALARMLQVNVLGATATLAALAPRMAARRKGHLVGISSVAAWIVVPRFGLYGATKRYLQAYCEGLDLDLREAGVRVTCINPGFVKSEMTADRHVPMPFLLETDDAANRMGRAILRGQRRYAFPWQMAWLTRFASLLPSWVLARAMRFRSERRTAAKQ
jgi:short-subunit dehydrogenase